MFGFQPFAKYECSPLSWRVLSQAKTEAGKDLQ